MYEDLAMTKLKLRSRDKITPYDTLKIPQCVAEILLTQDIQTLELSFGENKVIGKVTEYNSQFGTIILPNWMINKLDAKEGNSVNIAIKNVEKITKICAKCPKEIIDPVAILEFELRDRHLLYENDIISVKMFEKEYKFIIENIFNDENKINTGSLYQNNLSSEILFDVTTY
jgi:hypothetical protein